MLFLWVQDELSYDRYHEKAGRIYRVLLQYEVEGRFSQSATTSAPLAPALLNEFPEILNSVRFGRNGFVVSYQNKRFIEEVFFADPQVFDTFTFPLIKGEPKIVLKDPYSIVISETMCQKYFGDDDPIGKILTFDEWKRDFKITGIFRNIPQNSHFRFDFLGSFRDYASSHFDQWGISNYWTYILVSEDFSVDRYREKLPQFVEKYRGKESRYVYKTTFPLQPVTLIHLHSNLRNEIESNRDISTVYIFSAIALFILLIACLNYINLSTSKYVNRAREVGVRKVVGASRSQLIKQFLGESVLFSFIALLFAVMLTELFLPLFNSLARKELTINFFDNLFLTPVLVSVILFVGLASGILPAFFISALPPVKAIRGLHKASSEVYLLRKILVVSQFAISIIFIIGAIIISNQLNYMRNKKLGLDKEHVVGVPIYDKDVLKKLETIKTEFLQNPNISSVSASDYFPGKVNMYQNYWYEGMSSDMNPMIRWIVVDYNFLETFKIELVAGRNFSRDFQSDVEHAYVLNESALKEIGWDSALGKEFEIVNKGTIIGVVKDFHFKPLHQKIEPVALCIYPRLFQYVYIRISPEGISRTLDFLKNKWQELIPNQSFEYYFIDEAFDSLYKSEMRLSKIFSIVTALAIFIACLGLFGLAAFMAEQRTKEVGIRKVLGATVSNIVFMLSTEFTKWVLFANIIAWPVAYYAMHRWLQNFAYQTGIKAWVFPLAAFMAFGISLLATSFQAVKAALANPVDSLRYE